MLAVGATLRLDPDQSSQGNPEGESEVLKFAVQAAREE
jgi:hypothetical protein